jgi:hypothetical protein
MKRLERCLFPRGEFLNFFVIACLSAALSFLLIGRQVCQANWGLIDDHEIFYFLGPDLHLPLTDVWNTLLAKTEVGSLQGRFRPGYYAAKLIEASLWGGNVHLWYLARTIGFAIFLGSIWWLLRRFVGIWLSGALTAYISLLPLWAGIWSRLGPSEVYGAICIGIMLFGIYFIFFSDTPRTRNAGAIALTLATIALIGMKETFVPIAAGSAAVLILAGVRKTLSPSIIVILMLAIIAPLVVIVAIVSKQVFAIGMDYYAGAGEGRPLIHLVGHGLLSAVKRTWWFCATPMLFFGILKIMRRKPPGGWMTASGMAVGAYGFLVAMYALQSALYRSEFPLNSRYDFPAMLLVPLSLCVLACYVFYLTRALVAERTTNYLQFATAAMLFLFLALDPAGRVNGQALAAAVQANIETTNAFYDELQLVLRAAESSPPGPVILEAYGPGAYEPVFSLSSYLPALGARNRISVRLHPDEKSHGKAYDDLEQTLARLERDGTGAFTPLKENLSGRPHDCISIGINGPPDAGCSGFQLNTR